MSKYAKLENKLRLWKVLHGEKLTDPSIMKHCHLCKFYNICGLEDFARLVRYWSGDRIRKVPAGISHGNADCIEWIRHV